MTFSLCKTFADFCQGCLQCQVFAIPKETTILKSISEVWGWIQQPCLWLSSTSDSLCSCAPGPQWCTGMCCSATLDNQDASPEKRLQDHKEHQRTSASRSLLRKQEFPWICRPLLMILYFPCCPKLPYKTHQHSITGRMGLSPEYIFCLFTEVLPRFSKLLKVTTTTRGKYSSGSKWVKRTPPEISPYILDSGKHLLFHI